MKHLYLIAMALLLLGVALPNMELKAQIHIPISSFIGDSSSCNFKYPKQDIRTIYVDVCAKPKKNIFNSLAFEFTKPTLKFTREAMIFTTVKFVIAPYSRYIDIDRFWRLQILFNDGGGWVDIPSNGLTHISNFGSQGADIKLDYRAIVDPITPYFFNQITTDITTKPLFIKAEVSPYVKPDMIWKVNAGKFTPPAYASQSYAAGDPALATNDAEGLAYIKLAPGHTKLTKPIIFVDGIDFTAEKKRFVDDSIKLGPKYESNIVRCGGTGWDIFIKGAEDSWNEPGQTEAFREYPRMFQDLGSNGFDVVFLDFLQGDTYIQKNAMVLKALINRINNAKDANAKEENIVVGASMGGQVARMALAQMERDKESHCTRMYVSFDSPQKGANIPLSLQGFSWMAYYSKFITDNWTNLNTPAAKQMLIETLADDVAKGKVAIVASNGSLPISTAGLFLPNALRPAFVAEMAALGYPQKTQNIAISDGDEHGLAITGDNATPFPTNASMLRSQGTLLSTPVMAVDLFALNGAQSVAGFANNTVFKGQIPFFVNLNLDPTPQIFIQNLKVTFTSNQSFPSFDNAPGCMRGDLRGIKRLITESQKWLAEQVGNNGFLATLSLPAANFQPNFNFMSTISTLDIRNPNNPDEWNWDVNPSILTKNILSVDIHKNNLTPFFDHYAPLSGNLRHVEVDKPMRDWIKQLLDDTEKDDLTNYKVLPYSDFTTYNYNYRKNHITSVNINPSGILKVNSGDAYSAFENPLYYDRPMFEAHLGNFCGNATVTVDGGSFVLGALSDTKLNAIVNVTTGSKVILKSGDISVYNNSQLVVQEGGTLVIYGGAINLANVNSRIIIKKGGTLEIRGAIKVNGDGYIEFEEGNIIDAKVPTVMLSGNNKIKRFIKIDYNATVNISNASLYISTGTISYEQGASIVVKGAPSFNNKNPLSVSINNIIANGSNKHEAAFNLQLCNGNVEVSSSDFNNCDIGISMQQKLSGSFDCRNSSFKHCGYGITSDGGAANYTIREYTTFINNGLGCELSNQNGAIELSNTYFTNNKFGLKLDNNHQVMNVKSSTFSKNRRVGILTESIRSMVVSGCTFSDHNNKSFLAADDINLEINSPIYFDQPFEPCEKEELPCFGIFNVKNSNIILTNGTLFENNNFGVYKADPEKGIDVYHSKDSDALVIDCTTFDNNIYAIKGKSIEIQADATSNQLTSKTPVRSNNFIQGKQGKYFFDVAYFYKAAQPALILLRENYWNTKKNGPGMEPDPLTINFYSINFTNTPDCLHCPANNGGCIPYDASDYLSDPNGNCYPTGKSANDKIPTDEFLKISANGTCNTLVSSGFAGVKTPIHAQYRFAYNELFSPDSNIDKVMESFTRVAIMPLKKEDKSVCAQYIRVARAFTGYNPDNIGELEVGKVQQKAPIVASIYPNPADNMLQVNYDKGAFTVNVLDLKGQVIYKNEAEYGLEINTSTWQSGVYQVSITDKTTGNQSVKKVVIMRGN